MEKNRLSKMELDYEGIKKTLSYNSEKKVKITNGLKKFNFLLFDTKFKQEDIEFGDFLGDYVRKVRGQDLKNKINSDNLIENCLSQIDDIPTEKISYFKNFYKDLFFREEKILLTHPKLLSFLNSGKSKKISDYMKDVYGGKKVKELLESLENQNSKEDVLLRILIGSLGDLKIKEYPQKYVNKIEKLKENFELDLEFLIKNQVLIENLELFMKFYYFIYVSQFSLKINKFEDFDGENLEPLYFNFEWEKASKSRESYGKGYKHLENRGRNLFSHRTTLEILNWIKGYEGETLLYKDLIKQYENFSEYEKEKYKNEVIKVREWYISCIGDINWDEFKVSQDGTIQTEIKNLLRAIDYQFKISKSRNKPYKDYARWLTEIAKKDFSKKRGPLGFSLNLNQELTLLITKLSIGEKEKIRMIDLYEKFEERGIFLDSDSKESLVKFYEKLNILDKKSDSGDAIYVKSIL